MHDLPLSMRAGVHMLAAPSETEKSEWLEAIKEAIREDMLRRKKKKVPGPPSVKHVVKDDGLTQLYTIYPLTKFLLKS